MQILSCTDPATQVLNQQPKKLIHIFARQSPYIGTLIRRYPVFDKYVPWEVRETSKKKCMCVSVCSCVCVCVQVVCVQVCLCVGGCGCMYAGACRCMYAGVQVSVGVWCMHVCVQ